MEMTTENSAYIGDGVYAGYDGYSIWLHVGAHDDFTDVVCLEPNVLRNLIDFSKKKGIIK